jgi:hypothetical protein
LRIAEDFWVLRFRLMVKRGLQKEKRSMDHFAGLDVSVKETSICIVDDTGRIVRELKVASEPEALLSSCRRKTTVHSLLTYLEVSADRSYDRAYVSAFSEHFFPILLVIGLATRFSALALLCMTVVIEIFVYPGAWPTHGATCLLVVIARGPGWLSLDHLIARKCQ